MASRHNSRSHRWEFAGIPGAAPAPGVRLLMDGLRLSELSAGILSQRGFDTVESAETFLQKRMDGLHDPETLPDMPRAVARIAAAVEKNQRIVLFGDYDADGVTSTALVARYFDFLSKKTGKPLDYVARVPERANGYGLSLAAVQEIVALKPQLLITLDNGVTAHEAIAALNALGIDCIVVDHHLPDATLPPALAVVNAKRLDSVYPFKELCGAGVAFKLIWALSVHFCQSKKVSPEFRAYLLEAMALAAIGTVADVVPLQGENRLLVHHGLKLLPLTKLPGLRALLETARLLPLDTKKKDGISPGDIGFRLGPRVNAAGRCGRAADALEILLTDDPAKALELAARLEAFNTERQAIEETILEEARAQARAALAERPECRGFVLCSDGWHQGVIGIAASRIVEEFNRPAVLLAIDKARGMAHGSGRSIRNFNLHDALHATREHLKTFGGHAAAAGLTIETLRIDLFRAHFERTVFGLVSEADMIPRLRIDGRVSMLQLTARLCAEFDQFEPCGMGNPRPMLALTDVELPAPPRLMGRDEKHISFFARQNGTSRRVLGFNYADQFNTLCDFTQRRTLDLAFRPQLNTFNGQSNVELVLEAFRENLKQ